MKLALNLFILMSLICFSSVGRSENKFIVIRDEKDIPLDKFIYIIVNVETGERFLGYSKTDLEFNDDGKIVGGVRNGGHAYLLMHALGLEQFDTASLKAVLPERGKGEFVGGGFIKSSLGVTILHRAMSNKGAGALGESIKSTMNPRLPFINGVWAALVPLEAADELYEGIAKASGFPLVIDENILESERFVFNKAKHKSPLDYFAMVYHGTRWMKQIVSEVNEKLFAGTGLPKPTRLAVQAMEESAECTNLRYMRQIRTELARKNQ